MLGSRWVSRLFGPAPVAPSEPPRAPQAAEQPAPPPLAADAPDPSQVGDIDLTLSGWMNVETRELAPGFPISADDVVVDVGSGDGGMARFCAPRARETILIDQDQERLDRALQGLRERGCDRASGRIGDAARLPLADGSATRIVCTEVLEHVDDPDEVMAELVRIGRPSALYLLSVPGTVSERLQTKIAPPAYFERPNHIRIFEPDEFTALVERAGLVVEGRSTLGFFWTLWWMFFWQAGIDFGAGSHPLLDAWTRTWSELLKTPDAARIKVALDGVAPKVNAIVARKPA